MLHIDSVDFGNSYIPLQTHGLPFSAPHADYAKLDLAQWSPFPKYDTILRISEKDYSLNTHCRPPFRVIPDMLAFLLQRLIG